MCVCVCVAMVEVIAVGLCIDQGLHANIRHNRVHIDCCAVPKICVYTCMCIYAAILCMLPMCVYVCGKPHTYTIALLTCLEFLCCLQSCLPSLASRDDDDDDFWPSRLN